MSKESRRRRARRLMPAAEERQHVKGVAVLNLFFQGRPDMLNLPSRTLDEMKANKQRRAADQYED